MCLDLYNYIWFIVLGIHGAKLCTGCQCDADISIYMYCIYLEFLESEELVNCRQVHFVVFLQQSSIRSYAVSELEVLSQVFHGKHFISGCSCSQYCDPPCHDECPLRAQRTPVISIWDLLLRFIN